MKQNFLSCLRMIQSRLLSKFQSGQAALQMGGPGPNHQTNPLTVRSVYWEVPPIEGMGLMRSKQNYGSLIYMRG